MKDYTVPSCPDKETKWGNWTYNFRDGEEDDFYETVLDDVGLREEDIDIRRVTYRPTEIGGTLPTEDCKPGSQLPCTGQGSVGEESDESFGRSENECQDCDPVGSDRHLGEEDQGGLPSLCVDEERGGSINIQDDELDGLGTVNAKYTDKI